MNWARESCSRKNRRRARNRKMANEKLWRSRTALTLQKLSQHCQYKEGTYELMSGALSHEHSGLHLRRMANRNSEIDSWSVSLELDCHRRPFSVRFLCHPGNGSSFQSKKAEQKEYSLEVAQFLKCKPFA